MNQDQVLETSSISLFRKPTAPPRRPSPNHTQITQVRQEFLRSRDEKRANSVDPAACSRRVEEGTERDAESRVLEPGRV